MAAAGARRVGSSGPSPQDLSSRSRGWDPPRFGAPFHLRPGDSSWMVAPSTRRDRKGSNRRPTDSPRLDGRPLLSVNRGWTRVRSGENRWSQALVDLPYARSDHPRRINSAKAPARAVAAPDWLPMARIGAQKRAIISPRSVRPDLEAFRARERDDSCTSGCVGAPEWPETGSNLGAALRPLINASFGPGFERRWTRRWTRRWARTGPMERVPPGTRKGANPTPGGSAPSSGSRPGGRRASRPGRRRRRSRRCPSGQSG